MLEPPNYSITNNRGLTTKSELVVSIALDMC